MTMLYVWCVLLGNFVFSQHEFGSRIACEATRAMVIHELQTKKAEKISAYCLDEPST